jgi:hypothetical protein
MSDFKAGLLQSHKSKENEPEISSMIPRSNKFVRRRAQAPGGGLGTAPMLRTGGDNYSDTGGYHWTKT